MAIKNVALIDSLGKVVNIVVFDTTSSWTPPVGLTAVDDDGTAQIGGSYSNGVFSPAPVTPPGPFPQPILDEITRQLSFKNDPSRQALLDKLLTTPADQVETFIRGQINADSVTNLATAQTCLKRIETSFVTVAKLLALIASRPAPGV